LAKKPIRLQRWLPPPIPNTAARAGPPFFSYRRPSCSWDGANFKYEKFHTFLFQLSFYRLWIREPEPADLYYTMTEAGGVLVMIIAVAIALAGYFIYRHIPPGQLTVRGRSMRPTPGQRNDAHSGICLSMRVTSTVMSSTIAPS
jgi:hypothetical protein